jgi:hypothetical protein
MRWSWIAAGFLVTGMLRFALGHPDRRQQIELPAVRADVEAPAPQPTAAKESRAASPTAEGPSILSLVEVGPAELTKEESAPKAAPTGSPPEPPANTVSDVPISNWRRAWMDRRAAGSILRALHSALDVCSPQQLARHPRRVGPVDVDIEVWVKAQAGVESGVLQQVSFASPRLYMPLFEGCVRAALGSASLARPGTETHIRYSHLLEPPSAPPSSDSEDDGEDDSGEGTEEDSNS